MVRPHYHWLFVALAVIGAHLASAAEPIATPEPLPEPAGQPSVERILNNDAIQFAPSSGDLRIFPAVLETRRYGPVEEPAPQFYALRNSQEPGFDWGSAFANSWAGGWGWGQGWGWGSGWGFRSLPYAIGPVGYNRYFYRPWYTYPNSSVWSDRFPWYSPGGAGPNIYQPWYLQRNSVPWYSPYGIGPNIYTPSYQWNSYYPWYAPNGPGPNIYTPDYQFGGCLYW
jgi:hypothetical protein